MILLNPGPVSLSPQVRAALQGEDLCHREPEFAALTQRIRHKLETLYADAQPDYAAVLLTGSGSAAVEAMLSTFARHDAPTLVISNGVYGERMASMLQRQRKPYVPLAFAWGATIDLIQVTATLDSQPGIKHVAIVHHETTTGKLNALDDLAALCQSRDIGLLVDAVSSFGGEAIPFARWRPAAIAGTANKCLHGIPGVSLVLAPHAALSNARSLATTLYLDLELYYREQQSGWSPFTQSVQGFLALDAALLELHDNGGWPARQARYYQRSTQIRQVLTQCDVETLLAPEASSALLTAWRLPAHCSYNSLHDALKAAGFTIYAGQGALADRIFRIATMGDIADTDLARLLQALRDFFGGKHA